MIETTGSEVTVRLPKDARAVWASAAAVSDFTPVKIVGQTLGREARRGRKRLHKFAGPVVDKTTSQFLLASSWTETTSPFSNDPKQDLMPIGRRLPEIPLRAAADYVQWKPNIGIKMLAN